MLLEAKKINKRGGSSEDNFFKPCTTLHKCHCKGSKDSPLCFTLLLPKCASNFWAAACDQDEQVLTKLCIECSCDRGERAVKANLLTCSHAGAKFGCACLFLAATFVVNTKLCIECSCDKGLNQCSNLSLKGSRSTRQELKLASKY
jgi:hypothetical protein